MKNRIKKFRIELNLTQEDLAKKASLSRGALNKIENSKYTPSVDIAYNIAKTLGTTIEELFIFEDN